jgi:hypothetical protein
LLLDVERLQAVIAARVDVALDNVEGVTPGLSFALCQPAIDALHNVLIAILWPKLLSSALIKELLMNLFNLSIERGLCFGAAFGYKGVSGSVAAVWACRVKVAPIGAITARASLGEC